MEDVMTVETSECERNLDEMAVHARIAAGLFKALAHESRLMILLILAAGERSVGDLVVLLDQRQASVSQQLGRLRLEGLVGTRRDGKTIYYSLASEDVRAILVVLQQPDMLRRGSGRGRS